MLISAERHISISLCHHSWGVSELECTWVSSKQAPLSIAHPTPVFSTEHWFSLLRKERKALK